MQILIILLLLLNSTLIVESIYGGQIVTDSQFPWIVKVIQQFKYSKKKSWWCGGFLIKENVVMTAAHCVDKNYKDEEIFVKMGSSDLKSNQIKTMKVIAKKIHPNYDRKKALNDIALLKLSDRLNFDDTIQPILLPENSEEKNFYKSIQNDSLLVAGWGDAIDQIPQNLNQKLNIKKPSFLRMKKLK